MPYTVNLTTVPATPLLVVRRRVAQSQLSTVVPEGCGIVWKFVRATNVPSPGRHVAVYLNGNIDVEVGVEVGADATGGGDVIRSATPAGTVVTTTHIGSYAQLHAAHDAVLQWCKANRYRPAGASWEVYGHWNDDPAKVRTDVFYLVAADAGAAV